MVRYVLIGLVLFLGFAISFAPASLLGSILSQNTQADLIDSRGTLWRGQGQLMLEQTSLGQLDWDFRLLSLLRATPSYNWTLEHPGGKFTGTAGAGFSALHLQVSGQLQASAVNEWLRIYDINVSGGFDIEPTELSINHGEHTVAHLDGTLNWSGGLVRYVLSGKLYEATLPEMHAYLQMTDTGAPEAVVYAEDAETPLILASQNSSGFTRVGITKLFTRLLNNPWPGSDADHVVVLEVEEKIF